MGTDIEAILHRLSSKTDKKSMHQKLQLMSLMLQILQVMRDKHGITEVQDLINEILVVFQGEMVDYKVWIKNERNKGISIGEVVANLSQAYSPLDAKVKAYMKVFNALNEEDVSKIYDMVANKSKTDLENNSNTENQILDMFKSIEESNVLQMLKNIDPRAVQDAHKAKQKEVKEVQRSVQYFRKDIASLQKKLQVLQNKMQQIPDESPQKEDLLQEIKQTQEQIELTLNMACQYLAGIKNEYTDLPANLVISPINVSKVIAQFNRISKYLKTTTNIGAANKPMMLIANAINKLSTVEADKVKKFLDLLKDKQVKQQKQRDKVYKNILEEFKPAANAYWVKLLEQNTKLQHEDMLEEIYAIYAHANDEEIARTLQLYLQKTAGKAPGANILHSTKTIEEIYTSIIEEQYIPFYQQHTSKQFPEYLKAVANPDVAKEYHTLCVQNLVKKITKNSKNLLEDYTEDIDKLIQLDYSSDEEVANLILARREEESVLGDMSNFSQKITQEDIAQERINMRKSILKTILDKVGENISPEQDEILNILDENYKHYISASRYALGDVSHRELVLESYCRVKKNQLADKLSSVKSSLKKATLLQELTTEQVRLHFKRNAHQSIGQDETEDLQKIQKLLIQKVNRNKIDNSFCPQELQNRYIDNLLQEQTLSHSISIQYRNLVKESSQNDLEILAWHFDKNLEEIHDNYEDYLTMFKKEYQDQQSPNAVDEEDVLASLREQFVTTFTSKEYAKNKEFKQEKLRMLDVRNKWQHRVGANGQDIPIFHDDSLLNAKANYINKQTSDKFIQKLGERKFEKKAIKKASMFRLMDAGLEELDAKKYNFSSGMRRMLQERKDMTQRLFVVNKELEHESQKESEALNTVRDKAVKLTTAKFMSSAVDIHFNKIASLWNDLAKQVKKKQVDDLPYAWNIAQMILDVNVPVNIIKKTPLINKAIAWVCSSMLGIKDISDLQAVKKFKQTKIKVINKMLGENVNFAAFSNIAEHLKAIKKMLHNLKQGAFVSHVKNEYNLNIMEVDKNVNIESLSEQYLDKIPLIVKQKGRFHFFGYDHKGNIKITMINKPVMWVEKFFKDKKVSKSGLPIEVPFAKIPLTVKKMNETHKFHTGYLLTSNIKICSNPVLSTKLIVPPGEMQSVFHSSTTNAEKNKFKDTMQKLGVPLEHGGETIDYVGILLSKKKYSCSGGEWIEWMADMSTGFSNPDEYKDFTVAEKIGIILDKTCVKIKEESSFYFEKQTFQTLEVMHSIFSKIKLQHAGSKKAKKLYAKMQNLQKTFSEWKKDQGKIQEINDELNNLTMKLFRLDKQISDGELKENQANLLEKKRLIAQIRMLQQEIKQFKKKHLHAASTAVLSFLKTHTSSKLIPGKDIVGTPEEKSMFMHLQFMLSEQAASLNCLQNVKNFISSAEGEVTLKSLLVGTAQERKQANAILCACAQGGENASILEEDIEQLSMLEKKIPEIVKAMVNSAKTGVQKYMPSYMGAWKHIINAKVAEQVKSNFMKIFESGVGEKLNNLKEFNKVLHSMDNLKVDAKNHNKLIRTLDETVVLSVKDGFKQLNNTLGEKTDALQKFLKHQIQHSFAKKKNAKQQKRFAKLEYLRDLFTHQVRSGSQKKKQLKKAVKNKQLTSIGRVSEILANKADTLHARQQIELIFKMIEGVHIVKNKGFIDDYNDPLKPVVNKLVNLIAGPTLLTSIEEQVVNTDVTELPEKYEKLMKQAADSNAELLASFLNKPLSEIYALQKDSGAEIKLKDFFKTSQDLDRLKKAYISIFPANYEDIEWLNDVADTKAIKELLAKIFVHKYSALKRDEDFMLGVVRREHAKWDMIFKVVLLRSIENDTSKVFANFNKLTEQHARQVLQGIEFKSVFSSYSAIKTAKTKLEKLNNDKFVDLIMEDEIFREKVKEEILEKSATEFNLLSKLEEKNKGKNKILETQLQKLKDHYLNISDQIVFHNEKIEKIQLELHKLMQQKDDANKKSKEYKRKYIELDDELEKHRCKLYNLEQEAIYLAAAYQKKSSVLQVEVLFNTAATSVNEFYKKISTNYGKIPYKIVSYFKNISSVALDAQSYPVLSKIAIGAIKALGAVFVGRQDLSVKEKTINKKKTLLKKLKRVLAFILRKTKLGKLITIDVSLLKYFKLDKVLATDIKEDLHDIEILNQDLHLLEMNHNSGTIMKEKQPRGKKIITSWGPVPSSTLLRSSLVNRFLGKDYNDKLANPYVTSGVYFGYGPTFLALQKMLTEPEKVIKNSKEALLGLLSTKEDRALILLNLLGMGEVYATNYLLGYITLLKTPLLLGKDYVNELNSARVQGRKLKDLGVLQNKDDKVDVATIDYLGLLFGGEVGSDGSVYNTAKWIGQCLTGSSESMQMTVKDILFKIVEQTKINMNVYTEQKTVLLLQAMHNIINDTKILECQDGSLAELQDKCKNIVAVYKKSEEISGIIEGKRKEIMQYNNILIGMIGKKVEVTEENRHNIMKQRDKLQREIDIEKNRLIHEFSLALDQFRTQAKNINLSEDDPRKIIFTNLQTKFKSMSLLYSSCIFNRDIISEAVNSGLARELLQGNVKHIKLSKLLQVDKVRNQEQAEQLNKQPSIFSFLKEQMQALKNKSNVQSILKHKVNDMIRDNLQAAIKGFTVPEIDVGLQDLHRWGEELKTKNKSVVTDNKKVLASEYQQKGDKFINDSLAYINNALSTITPIRVERIMKVKEIISTSAMNTGQKIALFKGEVENFARTKNKIKDKIKQLKQYAKEQDDDWLNEMIQDKNTLLENKEKEFTKILKKGVWDTFDPLQKEMKKKLKNIAKLCHYDFKGHLPDITNYNDIIDSMNENSSIINTCIYNMQDLVKLETIANMDLFSPDEDEDEDENKDKKEEELKQRKQELYDDMDNFAKYQSYPSKDICNTVLSLGNDLDTIEEKCTEVNSLIQYIEKCLHNKELIDPKKLAVCTKILHQQVEGTKVLRKRMKNLNFICSELGDYPYKQQFEKNYNEYKHRNAIIMQQNKKWGKKIKHFLQLQRAISGQQARTIKNERDPKKLQEVLLQVILKEPPEFELINELLSRLMQHKKSIVLESITDNKGQSLLHMLSPSEDDSKYLHKMKLKICERLEENKFDLFVKDNNGKMPEYSIKKYIENNDVASKLPDFDSTWKQSIYDSDARVYFNKEKSAFDYFYNTLDALEQQLKSGSLNKREVMAQINTIRTQFDKRVAAIGTEYFSGAKSKCNAQTPDRLRTMLYGSDFAQSTKFSRGQQQGAIKMIEGKFKQCFAAYHTAFKT